MKIRSGFVSNSSTCAFILVGVKVTRSLLKKFEAMTDDERDNLYDNGYEGLTYQSEEGLLGVYHSIDTDGDAVSVLNIEEEIVEVKKVLGDDAKVKVFYGTAQC